MPRFQRYGLPFQYYRPYNYSPHNCPPRPAPPPEEIMPPSLPPKTIKQSDPVWHDWFCIKLYFYDVLILSLLFFLYKEEVKDEGLFLALVLLLIS